MESDDAPVDLTGVSEDDARSLGASGESSVALEDEPYRESSRFSAWRKHIRDLYQVCAHFETRWESRTIDFLPIAKEARGGDAVELSFVTGTATGGAEQNYLEISTVTLPTKFDLEPNYYNPEIQEMGGFGLAKGHPEIKTVTRMFHLGDVLKARCMPSNPHVVATSSKNGMVYLFDRSLIAATQPPNLPARPLLPRPEDPEVSGAIGAEARAAHLKRLEAFLEAREQQEKWDSQGKESNLTQHRLALGGLPSAGYALDWNTHIAGHLAAAAKRSLCIWNVASLPRTVAKSETALPPDVSIIIGENQLVNDVKWHRSDTNVLAAAVEIAGSEGAIVLADQRAQSPLTLRFGAATHSAAVSLDWSLEHPFTGCLGNTNGEVCLFDIRAPMQTISVATNHRRQTEVPKVSFSPHAAAVVASAGEDGAVVLHDFSADCSLAGEQSGLLFRHLGHVSTAFDVQWCPLPSLAGLLGSVDQSAAILWKPRDRFWRAT